LSVPLFASSLEPYRARLDEALARVVESGKFILGPEVAAFEEEFASYLGVRHCVGVANGTDALAIALRALGVGPGDEVVMPSLTFYATAEAAADVGAVPVFCDVDPDTACVTADTVRAVLTPRTRAIVPVDLFGNVAPAAELRGLGPPVLEDAAQAAGASLDGRRAGALGDAATFSFFPSKNLPCLGDGGAVVTDSHEVAEQARKLRFHGSRDKVTFEEVGYNSRLDELQAAALRVLLPELDAWTGARQAVAGEYERRGLGEHLTLPRPTEGAAHAYHLYVGRHPRADELAKALGARGVSARGYYRVPVHRQPAMQRFGAGADLPATEELAATNLALPMGTGLDPEAVGEVVDACASGST
jgi:dTDP-3-amino-3,4,6-trideoxy-alpha-D-glucose transaminase